MAVNDFSAMFWNIENFWGNVARTKDVEEHVRTLNPANNGPDIISFCEIKDKGKIREVIMERFSDYDFALTDTGAKSAIQNDRTEIELLVGWKRGKFDQTLFTQRIDLKGGRQSVRPGALLNVKTNGIWSSLLFLHTKSGAHKTGYNARKKTFKRIWKLKHALEQIDTTPNHSAGSRLIVMGDKNTMGNGASVSGSDEVRKLAYYADQNGMLMPAKEFDRTFGQNWGTNYELTSNLDHVLAFRTKLRKLGTRANDGKPFYVRVEGWNQLLGDNNALKKFEAGLSDHSALYVEVDL